MELIMVLVYAVSVLNARSRYPWHVGTFKYEDNCLYLWNTLSVNCLLWKAISIKFPIDRMVSICEAKPLRFLILNAALSVFFADF